MADASVARWAIFQLSLSGPPDSPSRNAFLTDLHATFSHRDSRRVLRVGGFYDGGDTYRVRFSPPLEGAWNYVTASTEPTLHGASGNLTVTSPAPGDHGPVETLGFGLVHADGTPHFSVGSTSYAWASQPYAMQE